MNEFKVGVMALASMVIVVVMSLLVTSNQSGFGAYTDYKTTITNASGIFPKTPIKVAGINAGRIKKITLVGNQAEITFEVLSRVEITEGSFLKIKSVGLLGDKYIEIHIANAKELVAEGAYIPSREGAGIENLVKDASEVMQDVKVLIENIKESFVPTGGQPVMKSIIADVQTTLRNTKELSGNLNTLVRGNSEKLQNIINNIETFSDQLAYQTDAEEPESAVADVKVILSKTDAMMSDLQTLVADIKDGKGTVGKLLVEEEIADEVKDTLSSVQKLMGRVDQIRTQFSVYTGANTGNGNVDTVAELRIFPSPGRFYLIGAATSEFGRADTTIKETSVGGGSPTVTETTERDKDDITLNLQLGRRIDNWTFRGGLFESVGGFGIDYHLDDWGVVATTEIFDYRDGLGPNIKLDLDLQIWNVFYGKVSGGDLINDPYVVYSLGLKFNDEDLKGFVGIFL